MVGVDGSQTLLNVTCSSLSLQHGAAGGDCGGALGDIISVPSCDVMKGARCSRRA
jgi:hypothetical protein